MTNHLILSGLSLERLAREAILVLKDELPAELKKIEIAWSGMDEELAGRLENTELAPCKLEPPVSWFVGHRKSAIDEPKDAYPLMTAMAFQLTPKPGQEIDQGYEGYATLYVEGFVKGATQGEVNRRVQRMAEAANNVLVAGTLNDTVTYVPMPDVVISDETDRTVGADSAGHYADGTGEVWWWQGFRLQYRLPTIHAVSARQVGHYLSPDGIGTNLVAIGG